LSESQITSLNRVLDFGSLEIAAIARSKRRGPAGRFNAAFFTAREAFKLSR